VNECGGSPALVVGGAGEIEGVMVGRPSAVAIRLSMAPGTGQAHFQSVCRCASQSGWVVVASRAASREVRSQSPQHCCSASRRPRNVGSEQREQGPEAHQGAEASSRRYLDNEETCNCFYWGGGEEEGERRGREREGGRGLDERGGGVWRGKGRRGGGGDGRRRSGKEREEVLVSFLGRTVAIRPPMHLQSEDMF
jgi:hypothetical protein